MSFRYTAAIFDMDGTLLDTLDDLADAVNATLSAHGFPLRSREEIREFVGNGVEKLMERALPDGKQTVARSADGQEVAFPALLSDFKTRYAACCRCKTRPYAGIPELLATLRAAGMPIAVVSNKFDAAVKELAAAYFGELIPVAVGERDGVRKKPAPDTVFEALRLLGLPAESPAPGVPCPIYIGDSDVDIATAEAAGLPCISVLWGFRPRTFLTAHGATCFAEEPSEVAEILLGKPTET